MFVEAKEMCWTLVDCLFFVQKSLTPMYYRGASAAVIVYDIRMKDSFKAMKAWVEELHQKAPPNIVIAICGNKVDLEGERSVARAEAEEYLESLVDAGGDKPIFFAN